MRNLCREFG